MLRKAIRGADGLVNWIVAFLCLISFLICLYATVDAVNVYLNANDTSVLKYKPALAQSGAAELGEISEDVAAWLSIEGTAIDYPVMQGDTNEIYLNTDPYGNFSLSGSIFLDYRNSGDFSDPYSLVYGHHMEFGAMFGSLDAFYQQDYFSKHRTGTLMTVEGRSYEIRFFACCKALANEALIFDPISADRESLLTYLEQNAAIFDGQSVSPDRRILALSTCQSAETMERLILFGCLWETAS